MNVFDILLPPIYLLVILLLAYKYKLKHQHEHIAFKYFLPGLIAKIIGAIALGLVYFYYYGGGDTLNYYYTAIALVDVLFENPSNFLHVYFGTPLFSEYYLLNSPKNFTYWVNDEYSYFVSKCFVPFIFIGGKSYITTAILVASGCYVGVWNLFMIYIKEFPHLIKQLCIPILFMPSVIFWGSGVLKDSLTLSATCLYVYAFYWLFVQKKYKLKFAFLLLFTSFLLVSIKPYILLALLPGSILWIVATRLSNIKNVLLKLLAAPLIIVTGAAILLSVMNYLEADLGQYSIDNVIVTASGAQKDLKQSYYSGNTFDIGDYEPTITGLLSVSHKAIFAALFRPTLFDTKNVVMLISAIENTSILGYCIFLLIRLKVFGFFKLVKSHPLVLFSFIFSIFFALSVGVSISNFGTLVRLKIPCIPFFISSLVVVQSMAKPKKNLYL
ncbi:MAG: hypothetical protein ACK504_03655 [Bacteroidota bacterium]